MSNSLVTHGLQPTRLLCPIFPRQGYWSQLQFPSLGQSSWPRDQTCISCLAGGFLTTEPPGKSRSYGNYIFNFLRNFWTVFHTFTFSPAKHKSSNFSIPLSTLAIFWHFNNSLDVKWCLMILICISLMTSGIEHLFMCLLVICMSLYIFFGEMSIQVLFLKSIFKSCSCGRSSLYSLDINPLSDT